MSRGEGCMECSNFNFALIVLVRQGGRWISLTIRDRDLPTGCVL